MRVILFTLQFSLAEKINLVLLIFITLLEFIAFGWLIIQMRKSGKERDKIIKLEERQIAMERRILKSLDVNQLARTPDLAEFLDHISIEGDAEVNLDEVHISSLSSSFENKTLSQIQARHHTGCTIIGVKSSDGKYIVNPGASTILKPNSKLFVLGSPEQITQFNDKLNLI
mgnify:CR=1 FL=1|tara:strand:+ start:170 stop:682 length:513 start_codon:yes stop_codon:yes gene_type:complete